MAPANSCPPLDQLRHLLAESPVDGAPSELVSHLGNCPECQQALERLAGGSPVLLDAASAHCGTGLKTEAPLRHVLDAVASDHQRTILYPPYTRAAWVRSLLRPAASPDLLGHLGEFDITEVLGQGGMGLVLKAFDSSLNRWVAIKVLAPNLADDAMARHRFAREAQAAAAIRHVNVVTIHAVNELNGLPYFVMEYISGGSLQDYVDANPPPDWRVCVQLGAEIAAGLSAAHARGLVHRDIKPSNILLQTDDSFAPLGLAKIGDFGLARAIDEVHLTQSGIVPGTPMFMAPEQALCAALDDRADLFSLGSVLYVLCTGQQPFPADTPLAVLRQVCEANPRPVRELNPAIPSWLASIIERLHAKRPEDRFASAAKVAELLHYNAAHPDRPRPVPPAVRAAPSRRRKTRLLAGTMAVASILTGGFIWKDRLPLVRGFRSGQELQAESSPARLRATLRGHKGPVWSVAFAPDGHTVATGGDDSALRLWDAASGREKAVLPGHEHAVLAVGYAHSGKFLVSGDSDGTLRVWDPMARAEITTLPHQGGNTRRLSISPDDQTVAVGTSGQGIELWDLQTGRIRRTLAGGRGTILPIVFAPDGNTLAAGDASGTIYWWGPANSAKARRLQGDPLGIRALAFTPDSQILAAAGSGDKDVKLWKVATLEKVATLSGFDNTVQSLAISPDGRLLATGTRDGTVTIFDLASLQTLATLQAHQGSVLGVAFSPDSHTLASAGEDRLARLWNVGDLRKKGD